ncbi:hypothetical protein PSPO01_15918 [Paraphaeosphaeria sporulosa]
MTIRPRKPSFRIPGRKVKNSHTRSSLLVQAEIRQGLTRFAFVVNRQQRMDCSIFG